MGVRNFLFLILLIFVVSPAFSYVPQDGNVWGVFGPTLSRPEFAKRDGEISAPWMGGFGIIAIGDINDKSSLELGLLYGNKVYLREVGPDTVEEQTQILHATVGYRYWLNRRWSVTGSFYTGYAIGDPSTIRRSLPDGEDHPTSAHDTSESGFDLSVEAELYQHERFAAVINTRYSYAYPMKSDEKSNQYGVLFGVRYFIQGRKKFTPEPPPPPVPATPPPVDLQNSNK